MKPPDRWASVLASMRSRSPVRFALPSLALLALLVVHACGPQSPPQEETDAGITAPPDGGSNGPDAGEDAGAPDAGIPDAGGPVDAGLTELPVEEWCEANALGFCLRARRCLQVSEDGSEWDACMTRQRMACDQTGFTRGVAEGRLGYDPAAAASCVNGYAKGSCVEAPAACAQVFTGQVAAEGTCLLAQECQAGSYCLNWTNTCPLTCHPYRAVGDTCNFSDQQCDPAEASCINVSGQNRCVARKAAGEACVNWNDCAQNHGCIDGVCVKQVARLGESCRERQGYPTCETDTFCRQEPPPPGGAQAPGVCMRKAALGGACVGFGSCLTGLRCSSNYATGTCIPLGGPGERCTNYNDCRSELYCAAATGRCAPLPTTGGDCSSTGSSYRCASGHWCDWNKGDTCQPLGQPGDDCNYSGACASNACVGAVCVETCSVRWDGGL